jgi:lipopolysaccharide transport system ATP-binding protein
MPDAVIKVEGLGKRYELTHETRHATLRDTLAHGTRGLLQRWLGRGAPRRATEEFWALRDVSFAVNPGEVVGIIGRNGAGKSTLLKILSRITEPTTGRVTLRGRVASLLEVGTGFHPDLTGRENVFLNGAILGMPAEVIRRRLDEIVAFAEVERFLDTPVKHYSSGMYVRLAFSVAAHLEPDILIVDEVLAVGDAAFQRKCLGKLEAATRQEGRTILFVSHNLTSVRQLCSRAILLGEGRLVANGTPAEVITTYMQAMPRTRESAAYRHIAGDGRARIGAIRFNAPAGTEPVYPVFETIRVELDYEAKDGTGPMEFFLLFHTEDGECLASCFQGDFGPMLSPAGPRGTLKVSFRNNFAPGRYLLSAGIFDRSRQFLDWVEFAEGFQVESGFADGRAFDQRLGRCYLQPEWNA